MTAVLMAASLFAGSALQAQDAPKDKPAAPPSGAPGGMRGRGLNFDSIAKQLDLTEDQKPKVKPIIDEWLQKMGDLRKDTSIAQEEKRPKMKELRDAVTEKLKDILTADQLTKWKNMGPGAGRPGGAGGPPPAATGAGTKAKDATPKN